MALINTNKFINKWPKNIVILSKSFSSNSAGKKYVAAHQSHSMGMSSAEVGVLEQRNDGCFSGLLESVQGSTLESELSLKVQVLEHLSN